MKSILWISPYVPYDKVDHAGGKNHNFYIKYFASKKYDITLLTLAHEKQIPKIDLDQYGIEYVIGTIKDNVFHKLIRYCYNLESEYSPFNKSCGVFSNYQKKILEQVINDFCKNCKDPDIVILQWTQTVLMINEIKKIFPNSKIVAIEEDVVYLAYERKLAYAHNFISKKVWKYKYRRIKNLEISALRQADLISVNNAKDKKLLLSEGFQKNIVLQGPIYYDNYGDVKRNVKNKDIIYFGAMGRKENYLSVEWLIKKILPLINDLEVNLLVIGGGGKDKLRKYRNPRIKILGFVEDLRPYFSESLCFVAPLVLGAGIKVKILEALSAGIPVLTNHIGIEGIDAIDGKEYLHCEKPEEYAEKIRYLINNPMIAEKISCSERAFIKNNFPLDLAMENLLKKMNTL